MEHGTVKSATINPAAVKLGRIQTERGPAVVRISGDTVEMLDLSSGDATTLQEILAAPNPAELAQQLPTLGIKTAVQAVRWLPPIDQQEVWAAGVTYKRSQTARMEESEAAASCYDRVYTADRPEIFFKATPSRCQGEGGKLRIRTDATWNVPEPELALVISPAGKIVGYTIGNDMSSRDIEGDNPLYLPQAKLYNDCCGLGPWITLADDMPERSTIGIRLEIRRDNEAVFSGETGVSEMARDLEELVSWLLRDNDMPNGAFLLTGTGVVPDSNFTLLPGDVVAISIDGIGTLTNSIVQGPARS